jgi:6-phosphogluconolactonase/glucosamine-6-phosphate isomerase/deaminase
VANRIEKSHAHRIILTLPVLKAARCIAFLAGGIGKAAALHEVFEGKAPRVKYPSKLARPSDGKSTWHLDRAVA